CCHRPNGGDEVAGGMVCPPCHIIPSLPYDLFSSGRMRAQTQKGPGDCRSSTQAKVGGSAVKCCWFPPAHSGLPPPATAPAPPPTPPRTLLRPGQCGRLQRYGRARRDLQGEGEPPSPRAAPPPPRRGAPHTRAGPVRR